MNLENKIISLILAVWWQKKFCRPVIKDLFARRISNTYNDPACCMFILLILFLDSLRFSAMIAVHYYSPYAALFIKFRRKNYRIKDYNIRSSKHVYLVHTGEMTSRSKLTLKYCYKENKILFTVSHKGLVCSCLMTLQMYKSHIIIRLDPCSYW